MLIDDRSGSISQADLMDLLRVARGWLDTPAGVMLLQSQQVVIEEALQRCFGQHLVQYGLAPSLLDGSQEVLRNRWHFDLIAEPPAIPLQEDQWPFAAQSLDVVLLHHGLDFCLSPRTLLREASQAVRAGGHIIILGFNPWSSWGLLGFAVEKRINGCYRPLLATQKWLDRTVFLERFGERHNLPVGGFYCLIARRQMYGVTPRKQPARAFPALNLPPLTVGTRRTQKRKSE